ncbi:hypothetical protein Lal_00033895 [Lupinus albus]|nr:hypothetical protein Lal_00033895 [Lupinus albus]
MKFEELLQDLKKMHVLGKVLTCKREVCHTRTCLFFCIRLIDIQLLMTLIELSAHKFQIRMMILNYTAWSNHI